MKKKITSIFIILSFITFLLIKIPKETDIPITTAKDQSPLTTINQTQNDSSNSDQTRSLLEKSTPRIDRTISADKIKDKKIILPLDKHQKVKIPGKQNLYHLPDLVASTTVKPASTSLYEWQGVLYYSSDLEVGKPVIYNPETHQYGYLSGEIISKGQFEKVSNIASENGWEVTYADEKLKTLIFRVAPELNPHDIALMLEPLDINWRFDVRYSTLKR